MTEDELVLAGGLQISGPFEDTSTFYLNTETTYYWSMSPANFYENYGVAFSVDRGYVHTYSYLSTNYGLRPVISLKHDTEFVRGGDGTPTNPYVIE